MTPAELPAYLEKIARGAGQRGAIAAADGMAHAYQGQVVRSMRGPSPSPPGTPPARVTGALARSVRSEPARAEGEYRAVSSVSPHTVYARIQQTGGTIHVVRARVLTNRRQFFGKQVTLPARPYMVMTAAARRAVHNAAVRAARGFLNGG